jgi:hypothetical protein
MSQQDFNTFKRHLKDWKETHPDDYDLFEEEMNGKDAIGYQKVLSLAVALVPAYRKLINQKANQGMFDDISDIEDLFTENKLAQTLFNESENPDKNTIIPAMLYRLYFGQSFERMVENYAGCRTLAISKNSLSNRQFVCSETNPSVWDFVPNPIGKNIIN